MRKWTKKDIKSLCQQLQSWWVFNRPYLRQGITVDEVWDTMPLDVRMGVVVGGLRGFQSGLRDRAEKERQMIEHYAGVWADSGTPRDPTGETRAHCAVMASDADKGVATLQKLIDRVEAEGLPPEVLSWRPQS